MHEPVAPQAAVVLLGGPSGAGKSRLADATGLLVVRLDDFYRDGDDPGLPRDRSTGIVDWDDPASWDADRAVAALDELCRTGGADLPVYDLAHDGTVGTRRVVLTGDPVFMAEGIFAPEVITACRERGILADALCVRQNRTITFVRRLVRDLRERRKPPRVLVRRGLHLWRTEPDVVARQVALGATCVTPAQGAARVAALTPRTSHPPGVGRPRR